MLVFVQNRAATSGGVPRKVSPEVHILGTGGADDGIKRIACTEVSDEVRKFGQFLKGLVFFCVPAEILITEMVDGADLIACGIGRPDHVAGGKACNKDAALQSSNLLPCSVGMIFISASGYSRFSSPPSKSRSRMRARLEISEWGGWVVTDIL